jgi:hypothetical protein
LFRIRPVRQTVHRAAVAESDRSFLFFDDEALNLALDTKYRALRRPACGQSIFTPETATEDNAGCFRQHGHVSAEVSARDF